MAFKYLAWRRESLKNKLKNNELLHQTKCILSIIKEKLWLEQMALEGWVLTDITWGIRYSFEKREPIKLIYEIDRFNLPKNPTLKEIRHKEEFFSMSSEMGWNVVLHDEDLNYYFCKEHKEGEINELYNDLDSKQFRADKYFKRYKEVENLMIKLSLIMAVLGLLLSTVLGIGKITSSSEKGFIIFLFGYLIFSLGFSLVCKRFAEIYYKDLMMTTQEWKDLHRSYNDNKIVHKLFLTNKKCNHFLSQQSIKGWHIVTMSFSKYIFSSGEPANYVYAMDSKYLTNQRIKAKGEKKIKDHKDWLGINNDWQVHSLKDAEGKNWTFVCALENQAILYRSQINSIPEALNERKYEKRIQCNSLIGQFGIWIIIGALVGLIIGILG